MNSDNTSSGRSRTTGDNNRGNLNSEEGNERVPGGNSTLASQDTGRLDASAAATAGSSTGRPDSALSDESTGTILYEDPKTGRVTRVPRNGELPSSKSPTQPKAQNVKIAPASLGAGKGTGGGKRPSIPSPAAFDGGTPIRPISASTPHQVSPDYFNLNHSDTGSPRPPYPNSQPSGSPHLPSSRRTSASAYPSHYDDSLENEESFGAFDNDNSRFGGDNDSISDTDDYSDEEERRRARHRHRRARQKKRAILRRTQSAAATVGNVSRLSGRDDHEEYDMLSDHEMTLKDRQDAINSSHPFGLPLWKPALYKKERSVQRAAESAVHSQPTAQRYITFDNILWVLLCGWWLSIVSLSTSILFSIIPGGRCYARLLRGLGWYLLWPFGRYVERTASGDRWSASVTADMRAEWAALESTRPSVRSVYGDVPEDDNVVYTDESELDDEDGHEHHRPRTLLRRLQHLGFAGIIYYTLYWLVIAPMLFSVSAVCWFFVFPLPMGKLNFGLLRHLRLTPLALRFRRGARRSPNSVVLLCTYKAAALRFYKYTYDGINIFFINLLPLVFFVLFCAHILGPYINPDHPLAQPQAVFMMCLGGAIPLAYFIGMAVSSISAQSSLGMGAVINATFGSIVEVILYSLAIVEGKARLVVGSLIGSLLAGLLLMPGLSMLAGGIRRKEQRFNSKSAGVTSTMLILSIIGVFTPTLFHGAFGTYELQCSECPKDFQAGETWKCGHCLSGRIDPQKDPFFQTHTKPLMYICTVMLPLAYIVALWFTLRTHVKLIYQEPSHDQSNAFRASFYKRLLPQLQQLIGVSAHTNQSVNQTDRPGSLADPSPGAPPPTLTQQPLPPGQRHPVAETGTTDPSHPPNNTLTVTVPLDVIQPHQFSGNEEEEHKGGHDAPEWGKLKSSIILLGCTVLFAAIAELLVNTVDEVMENISVDEKFLGLTLFALVPNVTEFMNAIAFALYGNIALSMEIGSAYAVQVTLLQIPALVAFSTWHNWGKVEIEQRFVFNLLFPRWDVIVIIFSVFLLTYTYIEGKSNYFKGSILTLTYLTFIASFFFEPPSLSASLGGEP